MTPERWKRVREVFEAAVGLAPEARTAFLRNASGSDAELKAEVETLLASADAAGSGFLESPPAAGLVDVSLAGDQSGSAVSPTRLTPGTRLGPYEILDRLGAGGMGEVYRAKDAKLKREVAIKVLPESLARDGGALARFEREALAVAALSHPNILAIHDFGRHGDVMYAVMELLEGGTLRDGLAAGPIAPKQAVDYALQIAKGLSAAHEKGIVHRDLKPENLFVAKDGHLKILDFGLAKRTDRALPADETSAPTTSQATEAGAVMGTVGYMSPEQAKGLPVDHRSDIFSFGAVFYEMLSGRRAFKADSAVETLGAILKEEPPEVPGVPPALDHIVRHCLEKNREDRFQSARDVVFALKEASSAPVSSGATSGASGGPLVASPSKKVLIPAVALGLVVLAAAGVFFFRRSRTGTPAGPKRVAVLPFENLGAAEDDYFADGIADEIRGKLTSLPGVEVIARASSTTYKKTTKTPKQIADELDVKYLLTATVRWQKSGPASRIRVTPELIEVGGGVAPTTLWEEAFDADLADVFSVQGQIAAKVAQSLDVFLSGKERGNLASRPTSNLAAYDSYLMGMEILEKTDSARAALKELEKAVALDPGFAVAWAQISLLHSSLYWFSDPSPQEAEAARSAAERAIELAPGLPQALSALAFFHSHVKRDGQARSLYARALEGAPGNVELLRGLAWHEIPGKAVELLRRAEQLDPRSVDVQDLLATHLLFLRRGSEARAACDRIHALAPASLSSYFYKAMTYLQEGDLAGARAPIAAVPKEVDPTALVARFGSELDLDWVLDDARRELLLRLTPGAFDDDRATWGIVLAQASSRRADPAKVHDYAEEARKSFAAKVAQDPGNGQISVSLGLSLAYLGKKEEAVREGERAVALPPVSNSADANPYLQHQLVRIHILCGNHERALDLLEPLLKVPYYLTPGWLRIDPNFDSLRGNPRFQRLVGK